MFRLSNPGFVKLRFMLTVNILEEHVRLPGKQWFAKLIANQMLL